MKYKDWFTNKYKARTYKSRYYITKMIIWTFNMNINNKDDIYWKKTI